MNFYQHQDRARRRTMLLVTYFILAVALIAVAVNAVVYLATQTASNAPLTPAAYLATPLWLWVSFAVIALIAAGTAYTSFRLRGGGAALAAMIGARRIDPDSPDVDERQLVNVVEEMSIASGLPVPALYVMDAEAGINAFVAGTRPTRTVMVVTRGALETFSRDELQGVIAHEYSHIFNNDMRINIRLMGVLAGILLIGQIGRVMLRSGARGRGKGSGQAAMIGFAVLAIGYIGLFFGSLIKAAISRQREFLADASAVQFTRNPDGIAGALQKIRDHTTGSLLDNAHSEDISHFCFGESVHYAFSALLATHPPLADRIRAINPRLAAGRATGEPLPERPGAPAAPTPASGLAGGAGLSGDGVAASVGTVDPAHLALAQRIHAGIPSGLVTAAHRAVSARQLIYALVLNATDDAGRERGFAEIAAAEGADSAAASAGFAAIIRTLPARTRLPLLNMSLPVLKTLGEVEREAFCARVERLVELDSRYTIFEFTLVRVLVDQLAGHGRRKTEPRYFRFDSVRSELVALLSVLARAGSSGESEARAAFDRAWKPFGDRSAAIVNSEDCTLSLLNSALAKLALLSPLLKRNVIGACADCVIHDGKVTAGEAELLQAVALSLDCPMPPVLDD